MKKEAMSGLSPVGFNDLRVSRMPVLFFSTAGSEENANISCRGRKPSGM